LAADLFDDQQLAMAAGNQQQQKGKGDVVGEPGGEGVAFEVVDGDERPLRDGGDGLGHGDADHDAADQAGPAGGGDAIEVGEAQVGAPHRLGDQAVEVVEMAAGGDLRHDAAIGTVLVELRQHDLGQHLPPVVHHRRCRFIAARFDPQNDHCHNLRRIRSRRQSIACVAMWP
jgi:hypothetical protein